MRVLLLSLVFRPDNVSTAHIMADLAADLVTSGHHVSVFTTTPHYNRDRGAEESQRLRWFWGPLLRTSESHGARVYHAWMPRKGASVILRLAAWVWFHLVSTVAAILLGGPTDVILAPSPPLTVGVSAWIVGRLRGAPFVYNVQEIYPDIAINLGALKNRRLIRVLRGLERFVYRRAHTITAISQRMRERLLEKGVAGDKVVIIPNFVDVESLTPRPKDNAFSRELGVVDKFIVSYAGNIGPAQGLECFIDAAALLRDLPDVRLMLIGDGSLVVPLRERAAALGLTNVVIVPYQPFSRVPDIYGASDVCVVAQAAATASDAIPSKVYRIMACERPIVAATEPASDLARLVLEADAGVVIAPGSADGLAAAVRDAVAHPDLWAARGVSGRRHVLTQYTRRTVSAHYRDTLSHAARDRAEERS
ncbi:MAG TPA: glycosyltransferase family 4 protein [Vicinamibacterales bacterium]|jgi:colanic acid biosynthesis glycosyl transferase WcaI|nr:glycosyltransferase family 4 protein [Vicinamibacterales bacterium]